MYFIFSLLNVFILIFVDLNKQISIGLIQNHLIKSNIIYLKDKSKDK